jgi:O-antigen ligase
MKTIITFTRQQVNQLLGTTDAAPQSTAAVIFVASFFYFLCSQLLTNSTFIYQIGFYGVLLPSFLFLAFRQRAFLASIPYHVGTLGLLAFFLFATAHAVLGTFPEQSVGKILKEITLNSMFLWMALAVFANRAINSPALLKSLMFTTLVMIPVSYVFYHYDPTKTENFLPIGRAHNPIPIGNLYAVAALIALWQYFQKSTCARLKIACAFCYLLAVLAIVMTTQRGPLLGLAAGTGLCVLLLCRLRYSLMAGLAAFALIADYLLYYTHGAGILPLDSLYSMATHFFTQRDSSRLIIWQHAFTRILDAPWRGHGLHAPFVMEGIPGAVNPHNLFLSTLYYYGILGLSLLLVPLFSAFVVCLKQRHSPYHQLCLILVVHAVVATFTNYGQVVQSPSPLWTIYWLPIAMALARPREAQLS